MTMTAEMWKPAGGEVPIRLLPLHDPASTKWVMHVAKHRPRVHYNTPIQGTASDIVFGATGCKKFPCTGNSCPACAVSKAQPLTRVNAKTRNFGALYGSMVHDSITADTRKLFSCGMLKLADKRKRSRRIQKKISLRHGRSSCKATDFELFMSTTKYTNAHYYSALHELTMLNWANRNREVIDELVSLGVPRAERRIIYSAMRRMTPGSQEPSE